MRSTLAGLALLSLALPVHASTWIVDISNGPGTNFTQISAAIVAAAPGDMLLVRPGQYAEFVLDKPLSIVGLGVAPQTWSTTLGMLVQNLPPNSTTSIANLTVNGIGWGGLQLRDCAGAVMLDGLESYDLIQVTNCTDLRLRRCETAVSMVSTASRVELGDSLLLGLSGWDCNCCWYPSHAGAGGPGLRVVGGEVHLARTTIIGGAGGSSNCPDLGCGDADAGDGGPGVLLSGGARLLVSGSSDRFVQGGAAGVSQCLGGFDGLPGAAVVIGAGCEARLSGETFSGAIVNNGGILVQPSPDDPFLRALGSPTAGAPFTLRLSGPPGATAQVLLGRRPIVVPTPALDEEQLVPINRVFNLGTIPASGTISLNFPVASFWPSGFSVVFQGRVTLPDTTQLFTNSLPAIVQ